MGRASERKGGREEMGGGTGESEGGLEGYVVFSTCTCVYMYSGMHTCSVQGVGFALLAPTPFIQNGFSAHSQIHEVVITHVGYGSAWHGSYDHPLPVPEHYI